MAWALMGIGLAAMRQTQELWPYTGATIQPKTDYIMTTLGMASLALVSG